MELTYIILIITLVIFGLMGLIYFLAAKYGFKLIFPGSGTPEAMSRILFNSVYTLLQFIIGIGVIVFLSILFINDSIDANVGVPVIAAIIAYLLGKGFTGGLPLNTGKGAKS